MNNVIFEIEVEGIEAIMHKIKAAIHTTKKNGTFYRDLKIAMPSYFKQLLEHNNNIYVANYIQVPYRTFLGLEVVKNYDNNIVIYHEDMPSLGIEPIKIELKKAP